LGRFHGRAISDATSQRLIDLGADPIRPPEGNAIAVEQYAAFAGIAAISLGWVPIAALTNRPLVRRPVTGLKLATSLAVIRNRGRQRPAADAFWALAGSGIDRD